MRRRHGKRNPVIAWGSLFVGAMAGGAAPLVQSLTTGTKPTTAALVKQTLTGASVGLLVSTLDNAFEGQGSTALIGALGAVLAFGGAIAVNQTTGAPATATPALPAATTPTA